jgi:hypothetical protein
VPASPCPGLAAARVHACRNLDLKVFFSVPSRPGRSRTGRERSAAALTLTAGAADRALLIADLTAAVTSRQMTGCFPWPPGPRSSNKYPSRILILVPSAAAHEKKSSNRSDPSPAGLRAAGSKMSPKPKNSPRMSPKSPTSPVAAGKTTADRCDRSDRNGPVFPVAQDRIGFCSLFEPSSAASLSFGSYPGDTDREAPVSTLIS